VRVLLSETAREGKFVATASRRLLWAVDCGEAACRRRPCRDLGRASQARYVPA